jgi:hypothetical protein
MRRLTNKFAMPSVTEYPVHGNPAGCRFTLRVLISASLLLQWRSGREVGAKFRVRCLQLGLPVGFALKGKPQGIGIEGPPSCVNCTCAGVVWAKAGAAISKPKAISVAER